MNNSIILVNVVVMSMLANVKSVNIILGRVFGRFLQRKLKNKQNNDQSCQLILSDT